MISKMVLEHVVMHRNRVIFSDVESANKGHNQKIELIKILKLVPVLCPCDEDDLLYKVFYRGYASSAKASYIYLNAYSFYARLFFLCLSRFKESQS